MEVDISLNGQTVRCVDLFTLSKWMDKSSRTVREWEEKGIFKKPYLRTPDIKLKNGSVRRGRRLYSKQLAHKLVLHASKIRKGIKVPDDVKMDIYRAFEEEKLMITRITGKVI